MLTGDEFLVIVRLTTGEQIMSALLNEDENYIQLLHPMVIRTVPNFESGREMVTVAPLCAFADDDTYILDKKNVLFIKRLGEKFVSHYLGVVKEQSVKFTPREDLSHLEEFEDPLEAIDQLRGIADETEEEKNRIYLEGNDTKH